MQKQIAIIGGGVSGLSAAFYLAQTGATIDLFEAQEKLGGRIGSQKMGERWIDLGGKNIGRQYHYFRDFLKQLGTFKFEHFGLNSGQQVGQGVVTLNQDKSKLYNAWQLLQRISLRDVYRLASLAWRIRQDRRQGFLNTPFFNQIAERYDQQPLSQHFGSKTLDYLIRPLTVRMNGAEPEECYLGNFGSNLNLLLDSYEQIQGGMQQWLTAFVQYSDKIQVRTQQTVQTLTQLDKKIRVQTAQNTQDYDHVIVALPAPQAALLVQDWLPKLATALQAIRYYPVAVAVVDYAQPVFDPSLRAMVFPRTKVLSNAGAYGVNELNLVRYTFSGAVARAAFEAYTSPIQLIAQAEQAMLRYFNIRDNPRRQYRYQHFAAGLCAYSPWHHRRLAEIQGLLPQSLTLVGDYWRGASIEACFQNSYEQIQQLRLNA